MRSFDKIQKLCRNAGFAVTALSQHIPGLNVTRSGVSTWNTRNSTPSPQNLKLIADYFGVPVESLLPDENEEFSVPGMQTLAVPPMHKLPVYGFVSAGLGTFAEEEIIDYEDAPIQYAEGSYYYLKVEGNSMEPNIHNGDLILVEKRPSVDSGQLAVVLIDGDEAVCKKVIYNKTTVSLISFNSDRYPPRVFKGDDLERIKVIGRVVRSISRW